VFGWVADFDHFEVIGAVENPMSNLRRLGDAIACSEDEWLTLVLVHNCDLASPAEDQLERDVMEVHIIGNRTCSGDSNVRRNDCSSLSIRDEIAVIHTCPPDVPRICRVSDRERTDQRGQVHGGHSVLEFDAQSVRSSNHPSTQQLGIRGHETNDGGLGGPQLQMDAAAESGDGATLRIIGRKDLFHEKADRFGEEVENGVQFGDEHYDSGTGVFSCVGHVPRIIESPGTFGVQRERKPRARVSLNGRGDERGIMRLNAIDSEIEQALAQAQLIALLPALAHLTGDMSILRDDLRPDPLLAAQEQGGLTSRQQADIREIAYEVLRAYRDGRETRPCSRADLVTIMSFAVGTEVGNEYVPLMLEELSVTGEDLRRPSWRKEEIAPDRDFHVVVIGAGMSGILMAHRLEQAGVSFEIIEKNSDVGGTWLENTYPGCRVDSSNHVYSYSFAQRHDWPYHFSTRDVLLDYFRGCADTFGLRDRTSFHTEVEELRWRSETSHWEISLHDTNSGARRAVRADAVIGAVGQLNRPKIPDISGMSSFAGPMFHSAQWRSDVDLIGKRVAVIGTGASGIQLIPEIARSSASVAVFQRTPTWLFPVQHYHEEVPSGFQWLLKTVPGYAQWYRFTLFWRATEGVLPSCVVDPTWDDGGLSVSAANRELRDLLTAYFELVLADRPDLIEKVIPSYPPASKRIVLDNGSWLRTLKRDNVALITESIAHIDADGITTQDGQHIDADVIIFATGFDASNFLTPMRVIGAQGQDLHQEWNGDARAFLGMAIPGFPNFFCMYGPNTNIVVNGSIIFFSECESTYILGCLEMILAQDLVSIEVKKAVHDSFNQRIDQGNEQMAWGVGTVNSWYRNSTGRVSQNWPFSLLEFWELTRHPEMPEFDTKVRS